MSRTPANLIKILQNVGSILVQKSRTRKYCTTKLKVIGSLIGISGVTMASVVPVSNIEEIPAAIEGGIRFLR